MPGDHRRFVPPFTRDIMERQLYMRRTNCDRFGTHMCSTPGYTEPECSLNALTPRFRGTEAGSWTRYSLLHLQLHGGFQRHGPCGPASNRIRGLDSVVVVNSVQEMGGWVRCIGLRE